MYSLDSQEQSENQVMLAYLQVFGEEVINLCDRESDCQMSTMDTYQQIRQLWLELKQEQPEIIKYIQEN